jgi:hypothetical protein
MTHEQAAAAGMVEKYLLDELSPAEREQFEEHFFECTVCAEDVLAGYRLKEALQTPPGEAQPANPKVVEMPPAQPAGRVHSEARPASRWAAIAAGALLCVVGYQNLVERPRMVQRIAAATSPYVPAKAVNFPMGSRAGEGDVPVFHSAEPLVLNIDIPAEKRWQEYELRISGPGPSYSVMITSEQARNTVPVTFPKGSLQPGTYRMQVLGRAIGGSTHLLQAGEFRIE